MWINIFNEIKDLVDSFTTTLQSVFANTDYNAIMIKPNMLWEFTGYNWLYFLLVTILLITLLYFICWIFKAIFRLFRGII